MIQNFNWSENVKPLYVISSGQIPPIGFVSDLVWELGFNYIFLVSDIDINSPLQPVSSISCKSERNNRLSVTARQSNFDAIGCKKSSHRLNLRLSEGIPEAYYTGKYNAHLICRQLLLNPLISAVLALKFSSSLCQDPDYHRLSSDMTAETR